MKKALSLVTATMMLVFAATTTLAATFNHSKASNDAKQISKTASQNAKSAVNLPETFAALAQLSEDADSASDTLKDSSTEKEDAKGVVEGLRDDFVEVVRALNEETDNKALQKKLTKSLFPSLKALHITIWGFGGGFGLGPDSVEDSTRPDLECPDSALCD